MSDRSEHLLDELVRLHVRVLRQEAASQSETIREMDALGFTSDRIAELLRTTTATVRNDLSRQKAAKNKPKRRVKASGGSDG